MRIVLDATSLPPQRVGVGRYVMELLRAVDGRHEDVEMHVLAKRRDAVDVGSHAPRARVHTVEVRGRATRILWEQAALGRAARRLAPDVFHGPHYTLPRSLSCPGVVVFHDPTFFTHPQLHERAKVLYFRSAARAGARRARRVIAVSEYGRQGAIEHVGADPERVDVVPQGIDLERYRPDPAPADAELRRRHGVDGPYLLWVGAVEPRKDVPTLVRAFAGLVAGGLPHRLVLAGPPAWGTRAALEAIRESGVSDRIVRTGYVTEEAQAALYRGASAFVYPSIAEGFGFPVLEAMGCGAPVVTTTGSAPEEVAGGAAALVPPTEPDALRNAVRRVLDDPGYAETLRGRGLERVQQFPWERTAFETVAAWRRAGEGV